MIIVSNSITKFGSWLTLVMDLLGEMFTSCQFNGENSTSINWQS